MHKGVILLVKANDKEDAISKVNDFMEPYGEGDVWDWYKIGGRWNNNLAPKDRLDQWNKKAQDLLKTEEKGWISQKDVDDNQQTLQDMWEELGLKGKNPYCNHYKLSSEGNEYDVIPLSECVETVKEWLRDIEKEEKELFEKMVEERKKEEAGNKSSMSGYYAGLYKDIKYDNFCFESNVYDITEQIGEKIPEDISGYFAVMVDMHN